VCELQTHSVGGDFRMRVTCEDKALEKHGSLSTSVGRRLGYLSVLELNVHSH
jgi:hypothetical protein